MVAASERCEPIGHMGPFRGFPPDPAPRKCDTIGCDRPPAAPVLRFDPTQKQDAQEMLAFSDGKRPTWVWSCECGWKRSQPVRPGP